MALTAADIKFFAAANQTDNADGGGRRGSTIVQNGLDNNLFPDVSSGDRTTGMTRVRKVYPSLTNTDATALLSGSVVMNSAPTDPATQFAMWAFGGAATTRVDAVAGLIGGVLASSAANHYFLSGTATAGSAVVASVTIPGDTFLFDAALLGQWVLIRGDNITTSTGNPSAGYKYAIRRLISRDVPGATNLTFDSNLPFSGTVSGQLLNMGGNFSSSDQGRVYGTVSSFAAINSGTDAFTLARPGAQVAAVGDGLAFPAPPPPGFSASAVFDILKVSLGYVAVIRPGDMVTLWDEQATTAATAVNGTPINVGRTNLDQIAIVGANGNEIVRFVLNGPTPVPTSGTVTADLAAGTITPTSVTGWSQPVTVRHRIAHRTTVGTVNGPSGTLAAPVTRDFPAGSKISSHVPVGDVRASAGNVFAQQAWTRVFSDTLIGNSVTMPYAGTPGVTNQGAETDRWAIVFKTGNTFDCYSEALGLVASSNTASNFSPINPATGAPFFTLLSASWAASILVGSVLRFNTTAAAPPVWVSRCTVPSSPFGNTKTALRLMGSVDA